MNDFTETINALKAQTQRDELREWLNIQDPASDDLKSRALLSYVDDWLRLTLTSQTFSLDHFMSDDFSSIMYGNCPVIFFGTNYWATKRLYQQNELNIELGKWRNHLNNVLNCTTVPIYCCVVPEKDTLLRHFSRFDNDSLLLTNSIEQLMLEYNERIAGFSYMHSALDVPDKRIHNYEYYDSHLLSRDYLGIFLNAMQGLGLSDELDRERIVLRPDQHIGDLANKLQASSITAPYLALTCLDEGAELVSGNETFNNPLRDTQQSFKSRNASIKAKIAVYGDSHSSIYDQKKLTYLFANSFEECDFYWDPFCINSQQPVKDADFIIFEISQRFII